MDGDSSLSKRAIFLMAVLVTGAIAGAFIWLLLFIMNLGISAVWDRVPIYLGEFYPVIVCLIGGVVIGLFAERFGDYPDTLPQVMAKVKEDGRYEYHDLGAMSVGAILPLVFGGSVGPEAGLTGVIAAVCTWVGDRMRLLGRDIRDLTEVSVYAALSAIFSAPLFGLSGAVEDRTAMPKAMKIMTYVFAIAGAFSVFIILSHVFGGGLSLPRYPDVVYGQGEFIWLIPLCIIGGMAGWLFCVMEKVMGKVSDLFGERRVLKAVTGGLILGVCGMMLPYTMFSGEMQAEVLNETWMTMSAAVLITTGFIKVILTATCVNLGWRGGHFFPVIFAGISIGFGMSVLMGVDPAFSVCATTAALVGGVTRKPLVTVLLLFLCFPIHSVLVLAVSAFIGARIPLPRFVSSRDG